MANYSALDHPEILSFLFHPRRDTGLSGDDSGFHDFFIPVEDNVSVHARFYPSDVNAPTILFFHGNGEIVGDYADMAPLYTNMGINFFPADYRGYGRSTGFPTVTAMMEDAHKIFSFVKDTLKEKGYTGPVIIMGRSLGSAPALELASHYQDDISAMIIESGFAFALPLLRLLGIDVDSLGISEEDGLQNIDRVKHFKKPSLFIHAEFDHIIPFTDAVALHHACPASEKHLLKIPRANHNTIFAYGMKEYMAAVKEIAGV
jgi:uncharacterized protein